MDSMFCQSPVAEEISWLVTVKLLDIMIVSFIKIITKVEEVIFALV